MAAGMHRAGTAAIATLAAAVLAAHTAVARAETTVDISDTGDRYYLTVLNAKGSIRDDSIRIGFNKSTGSVIVRDPDGTTPLDRGCEQVTATALDCGYADIIAVSTITGDDRVLLGRKVEGTYVGADGGPGDDVLVTRASYGGSQLYGEGGDDVLIGGRGEDGLYGGIGNDELFGGGAEDFLLAGSGEDELTGGNGMDFLSGKVGRDRLNAADGDVDGKLSCGKGDGDRLLRDREDQRRSGCEVQRIAK